MDLVHQVAAHLKIEEGQAEKGIGAILMALRASVDSDTFTRVKEAFPNSERLMGRALMSAARTAEMPVLRGASGLAAALAAAGYSEADVPRLGRLVLEHLRPVIGNPAADAFLAGATALRG